MTTTLVTGGTGFIGAQVVDALLRRGDDVRVLARRKSDLRTFEGIEFERVIGDITDRRAVRRAVKDVEKVFHLAGTTSMAVGSGDEAFEVNVGGTRLVMEEALRAGVSRVIHTSSSAAVGPAEPGGATDESQVFTAGDLGIAYVNSKHEAETEVFRAAAAGLEVVIVNPTFVLGPGRRGDASHNLIKRILLRQIPAYIEGGVNIVDVRDAAAAHILADEKGTSGERYLIGGRNFTFTRLFADIARVSGVASPPVKVPLGPTLVTAQLAERLGLPVPVSRDELVAASQWWTFRCTKAKRELGFNARPHEETLEDAIAWETERLGNRVGRAPRSEPVLRMIGNAFRLGERLIP